MNVINNPAVLDELDDRTAISVAQKALRELDEMLRRHQESNKGPKGTQSDTRSRLERQRNVLLWQLGRRESRALTVGGPSSSAESRPRHEPAKLRSAKGQQETGQQLGEPSSSRAIPGRRQQSSGSARKVPGAWPQVPNTGPLLSCNICMDNHPSDDSVTFACNHHCCRECLNTIYKGATDDEARYPPRCCQPIPIEQSRRLLKADVLSNFLAKQVEWESKDRIYCSNKTCSAFIRPENIRGKKAKRLKCGTSTCADCKKAAHSSKRPCTGDGHGTRLALKVMEENKWARCPGCNTGVERAEGCNHMK
jgi:IBR domain, a half RING-finger domain